MPNFIVNRNAQVGSGDHEVHDLASTRGCLPLEENRLSLGIHATCSEAVRDAKRYYSDSNGCAWCIPGCHTT
jgi:hypothetical protein